jgi:membrane-associated phospholipid phosphatase
MSEKTNEILSKKSLLIIEIGWFLIFTIGIILALFFNEAFYSPIPAVRTIFEVITYLGENVVLITMSAFFFIVYDKKFAKNFTFSLLASGYINGVLKSTFKDPRPLTNVDPLADYGLTHTDYGFPSGHSQAAVATWGYLAYEFKDQSKLKPIIPSLICSIVIFLVAISRIIIGVHDMNDIVGGVLISILILLVFIYIEPIISEKINPLSLPLKIILSIVVSIVLLLIGILIAPTAGLEMVPGVDPYPDAGNYALIAGAVLGLSVGYLLEAEYVKYDTSAIDNKQKLINLVIGMVILLVVFFLLEYIFKINVITRFIRYAIIAFIVTFVLPLIFTKINKK